MRKSSDMSTLYDDDILLWSEQQAAAIRRFGCSAREIPNELDIENVAEEIEGVGRSELAAVESDLELIFVHLIRLVVEPNSNSVRHWRSEIVGFHANARRRYSPSMRQRIDVNALWRSAREQSLPAYEGAEHERVTGLSSKAPLTLDELLAETIDVAGLASRLH
jgi:uncharacterized protein DUF29